MGKGKTFFTKNNPNYVGEVVSDSPRADAIILFQLMQMVLVKK